MLCGVPKQSVILDILIDHEKSRAREEILPLPLDASLWWHHKASSGHHILRGLLSV